MAFNRQRRLLAMQAKLVPVRPCYEPSQNILMVGPQSELGLNHIRSIASFQNTSASQRPSLSCRNRAHLSDAGRAAWAASGPTQAGD